MVVQVGARSLARSTRDDAGAEDHPGEAGLRDPLRDRAQRKRDEGRVDDHHGKDERAVAGDVAGDEEGGGEDGHDRRAGDDEPGPDPADHHPGAEQDRVDGEARDHGR